MRCLTFNEFHKEAEPALKKIFLNYEPTEPLFGDYAQVKKIIYEYWSPDSQIIDLIAEVASSLGDTGFYFSIMLRPKQSDFSNPYSYAYDHTYDWWIPFDDLSVYKSGDTNIFGSAYSLQNAIYSPHGRWALISSFEHFGILAGVGECIDRVCQGIPDIDQQVKLYIAHLKQCKAESSRNSFDASWLPRLLERVYGYETTNKLLEGTGLP